MKNLWLYLIAALIGALVGAALLQNTPEPTATPITLETLPSQEDMQLALVRLGANIEVDGVIGASTRKEWDRLYCDRMALEMWPKGE